MFEKVDYESELKKAHKNWLAENCRCPKDECVCMDCDDWYVEEMERIALALEPEPREEEYLA
jgi:hypothetical protein